MVTGKLLELKIATLTKWDIALVQLLADDLRPFQISNCRSDMQFSNRAIEKKIGEIKNQFDCKTVGGLLALFFRNKLIK